MKVLKIQDITKKFGETIAVDNISLMIEEGEIFGLLGPNGAGKSTTINIVCGLISMNKGIVKILEKDIKKERNLTKSYIGVVPQDIAIYEDLTTLENVKFFAGLYGLRGKELNERAMEALLFVGLSDQAKAFPKSFSGGMKRRLNIACAIAHRPKLIIMDEPTVGIDPQSRNHILQSVKKLNSMGCTIIYTSHYMEEVEEICTKIAIIDHGKVIAEGTKEELESIITDTNSVWITVDNTSKVDIEALKNIKGVCSAEIEENVIKVNTTREISNLDKIILYLTETNTAIRNIESRVPDLETVFLTLTGRKLRD